MNRLYTHRNLSLPVLVLALVAFVLPVQGADDDPAALRKEALKLNDIVGDKLIEEQIDTLGKKPDHAKKLLAAVTPLAKDKDSPFNYTGAYILANVAREVKDLEAGRAFYKLCIDRADKLKSERKLTLSYLELVDLLFAHKKYKEAEDLCKEFLDVKGNNEVNRGKALALRRIVQVTALQGKNDEALKLLEPFVKAAGDDPAVLDIQAWLMRHMGKYDDAVKAYEKAMEKVDNEDLKDRFRYLLSGLYVELNNIDKASDYLQNLLKKQPDNPTYNNDLGYIWAEHDRNLPEAEKMIRKALDKEPNSSAYLDSMAWVLHKQKKHKEAKEYILKAIKNPEGEHAEIFDHLGDIHKALGEKAEAVAAWKKAIELSETSEREKKRKAEIEKKLKENQ